MRYIVRGMYIELGMAPITKCSAPKKFYTCVQRNYFELTITSEVSASTYLFLFKVTRVKIRAFFCKTLYIFLVDIQNFNLTAELQYCI